MARQESDREDLLREATALVERIEIAPTGVSASEHVVVGFRDNGAASFFFGADPVYQFNPAGQLRRAYYRGRLIKVDHGRLMSLTRKRLENETQLLSRELSDREQSELIERMRERLGELAESLASERLTIIGQVPVDVSVLTRVQTWLATHEIGPVAKSSRAEG
jgi:hypothetical protein